MNSKLFKLAFLTALISAAAIAALFIPLNSSLAAGAFNPKPLFEVGVGDKSPEMLGESTDESKILNYDKFYYPAAMAVSEQENRIFVLDSIKNRICAYTLSGSLAYEIKLPFEHHAIDMTYFKNFKRFFIVFQQAASIGVVDIAENGGKAAISASKLLGLDAALGADKTQPVNIQNVWPCGASSSEKNTLLLTAFFCDYKNILVNYENGSLTKAKTDFKIKDYAVASSAGPYIMALDAGTAESRLVRENIADGDTDWHVLLKDLTLAKPGFNCRNIRIIGNDGAGCSYVEAHYGFGEDKIEKTFVYKFTKNGRFGGRTEIFQSPEMLTNRFVAVDAGGAIFYMKKDEKNNKIQFYKFTIDELN
ncbi:MAG TPA: hypothetical protein PKW98_07555 [Candidatus Wallbacteria bacterium]|nr:MAG: hypothetical protein BWY32_01236 [bacterium ADurb.Bin243]HPG57658.1 hypothetical protein [Candidatus Wallbacteria bacterium]